MSTTSDEMWVGAATDHEAQEHAQRLSAARIAAHDILAALTRVGSKAEHVHRKALYSDRLDTICAALAEGSEFAVLRSDLEASLDHDFEIIEKAAADEVRSLSEIAAEIRRDWGSKVNFAAVPYLDAIRGLDKITDRYGAEDARSIVSYFISNSGTWRGETAKRVKAELKDMLKKAYGAKIADLAYVNDTGWDEIPVEATLGGGTDLRRHLSYEGREYVLHVYDQGTSTKSGAIEAGRTWEIETGSITGSRSVATGHSPSESQAKNDAEQALVALTGQGVQQSMFGSKESGRETTVKDLKAGDVIEGVTDNNGGPLTVSEVEVLGPITIIDFTDSTASPPVGSDSPVTVVGSVRRCGAKITCNKCGSALKWNGNEYEDTEGNVSCPKGAAHESSDAYNGRPKPANASKQAAEVATCPHCGESLGDAGKDVKAGDTCPKCGKGLVNQGHFETAASWTEGGPVGFESADTGWRPTGSKCDVCGKDVAWSNSEQRYFHTEDMGVPAEHVDHEPTIAEDKYKGASKTADRYANDPHWITTTYPGQCRKCKASIPRGARAWYWPSVKINGLECETHGEESERRFLSEIGEVYGSLVVHGVSLTRVRLHEDNLIGTPARDGHLFRGTDPSGKEVVFKTTKEDAQQIIDVMIGDLAGNFSGVSIEESDIVSEGSKTAFTEGVDCPGSNEHVEGDFGGEKGGITGNPQEKTAACPKCGQQVSVSGGGYLHTHLLPGKKKEERTSSMRKGAPFAGYEDFDACVAANSDKDDPEAYCGKIKHEVEGSVAEWARDLGIKPIVEPHTAAWQRGFDAGRLHAIDQPEAWVNTRLAGAADDPEQEGFIAGWQYEKAAAYEDLQGLGVDALSDLWQEAKASGDMGKAWAIARVIEDMDEHHQLGTSKTAADALPQFQKKEPTPEDAGAQDPAEQEEASAPPEGLDPAEMQPGQEVGLTYTLTGEAAGEGETVATLESFDQATGKAIFNCETGRFAVTKGPGGNWVDAAGTEFSFSPQGQPSEAAPVPPGNPNEPPVEEEDPAKKKKPPFQSSRRPFVVESSLSKLLDAAKKVVSGHGFVNVDEQGNVVETKWGYTNEDGEPVDGSTEYATEGIVGDGMILDPTTANLIVQAYEIMSDEAKAKAENLSVSQIVDVLWKAVGRSRQGSLQVEAWKQGDYVEEIATGKQGYIWYKSGGDIEVRFEDRTTGYFPNGKGLRKPTPKPWTGDSYDPSMWNDMPKGGSLVEAARCDRCMGRGRVLSLKGGSRQCPECGGTGKTANIFSNDNPFLNDDVADTAPDMADPTNAPPTEVGAPNEVGMNTRPVTTKPRQIPTSTTPQVPGQQPGDVRQGFQ